METVFLGLGANLKSPKMAIENALEKISHLKNTYLVQISSIYETTPISDIPQNNYLNAACEIQTSLSPTSLLYHLQEIEEDLGKIPKAKNAPRTIDIDILFFGKREINSHNLTIPHKEALNRLFVLVPLKDLTDTIELPSAEKLHLREKIKKFDNIHNEKIHKVLL